MRNGFRSSCFAAILPAVCLLSPVADGQERFGTAAAKAAANQVPRLSDGRPDLGNGKGVWNPRIVDDISGNGGGEKDEQTRVTQRKLVDQRIDVPFLPWAKQVYEQREATLSKEDPEGYCLPPGIPRMMNTPFPMQIYQLPDRILQVYEGGAHMWRIIYMDGRAHPKPPELNPTYLGHSIGRWEGDTLVVDVVGFNDRTWLDAAGHPHTEKLHVIERYTRLDENTLHYQATIDDPGAYTKPWTVGWKISWQAGWDPLEYVCQENNRDVGVNGHMVGLRPGEKHP
ncbi:MAG: hypothetical protein JO323_13385 [Acidobacteriia bacterium]|nr:hypothetical protein [Terriglobia bacterium]